MKDIPTPLTDAQPAIEIYDNAGMQYDSNLVTRDFARYLERELAQAIQRLGTVTTERDHYRQVSAETKLCLEVSRKEIEQYRRTYESPARSTEE